MKNVFVASCAVPALAALLGAGCAERPFVRQDPPVSSQGVTVSLAGEKCDREAWYENYDVLDLDMMVKVTNASSAPVTVNPAELRLLARGNSPVARASRPKWGDDAVEIAPHSSADVHVRFQRWGNARCDQEMQLSMGAAVVQSGQNVTLAPISFVATRTDA